MRRHRFRFLLVLLTLFVSPMLRGDPVPASAAPALGPAGVPAARVLATIDLPGELAWFTLGDTGVLTAYADGTLEMFDLLADDAAAPKTLVLPGLGRRGSVVPVPATGLLLVPDAPGARPGAPRRSLAIDTLAGSILWTGPSLGTLVDVELLLEPGVAVLRTAGGPHGTTALDIATGEILWQRDGVWLMWTEGRRIGLAADGILTVDPRRGTVLRHAAIETGRKLFLYSFADDARLMLRKGRRFRGLVYPPYEGPSSREKPQELTLETAWEFRAGSPMLEGCFKNGACRVHRPAPNRLLIRSGRYELLDLTSGRLLWQRKRGKLRTTYLAFSPSGRTIAIATSDGLEVVDSGSGRTIHELRYPKNLAGLKMSKSVRFIDEDIAMTVFPDRKGEPRGLTAFSCGQGRPLWSIELPRAARYELTGKEQARLFARIAAALVATAVSASNPVSYGGASHALVFVPDLDVRRIPGLLDSARPGTAEEGYLAAHFPAAVGRYRRLAPMLERRRREGRCFVTGGRKRYEILRLSLNDGKLTPIATHAASPVHGIHADPGFRRAVSIENEKRRLRILSLEPKAARTRD